MKSRCIHVSAEQREVFVLHEETGLNLEEIGELTGVGMETAKSRLRYALAKLRQSLADVRDARRRGDRTDDGRVGDDELEQELCPVRAVGFARPRRQRLSFDRADQRAFTKRPVSRIRDRPFRPDGLVQVAVVCAARFGLLHHAGV